MERVPVQSLPTADARPPSTHQLYSTQHVLRVFIASPGDVVEERHAARQVVDNLNDVLHGHLGWHVQLLGWEDTLPGCGRPQGIINKDVDTCDLFLGVVWQRWGSPTGRYSSGFEEEFKRALRRHRKMGAPEIWLSFRAVDSDRIKDPGDQLKRVLAFRQDQIKSRDVLFKEHADKDEWATNLYKWLLTYILDRASSPARSDSADVAAPAAPPLIASAATSASAPAHVSAETGAAEQLLALLGVLTHSVDAVKADVGLRDLGISDRFDAARLHLLSTALLGRYTEEELGVREINILYGFKERLRATFAELLLLARTLIGTLHDNAPGWYWFKDVPDIGTFLFYLAALGPTDTVRELAIDLIGRAGIGPASAALGAGDLLPVVVRNNTNTVRRAVLRYLGRIGTMDQLYLVDEAGREDNPDTRASAAQARLSIVARHDPNQAFSDLVAEANAHVDTQLVLREIERRADELDTNLLVSAVRDSALADAIRLFALSELRRRKAVPEAIAAALLRDSSLEVRCAAHEDAIERGVPSTADDIREALQGAPSEVIEDLILQIYRRLSASDLRHDINFYSLDGPVAYRALALYHFPDVAESVRSDLADGFMSLKEEAINRWRAQYGEQSDDLIKSWQKYDQFLAQRYAAAALVGLAANGDMRDSHLGRRYLSDSDPRMGQAAIDVLERCGTASDANALVDFARKTYYRHIKERAASLALRLDPGLSGTIDALLQSGDTILTGTAIRSLDRVNTDQGWEKVEPLLTSDKADIRVQATAYAVAMMPTENLEQLLEQYALRPTYFFNVVCWLDRVLYAPLPLRDLYRRDLEDRLRPATMPAS